jgi:hypothetical protein
MMQHFHFYMYYSSDKIMKKQVNPNSVSPIIFSQTADPFCEPKVWEFLTTVKQAMNSAADTS